MVGHTGTFGHTISTVKWGTVDLTKDIEGTMFTNATRNSIWSVHGVTGGTQTVTVTFANPVTYKSMAVTAITGITGVDKTKFGGNVSNSPTSGATTATTKADEYLAGIVSWSATSGSNQGTWNNSFSDGQSISTNFSQQISEGYRFVQSTGAYTASKSSAVTSSWTACIATYFVSDTILSSSSSSSSTSSTSSTSSSSSSSSSSSTVLKLSSSSTQIEHGTFRAIDFGDNSFNGLYLWVADQSGGDIFDIFTNGSRYMFLVQSLNVYVMSTAISTAQIYYQSTDPWPQSTWIEQIGTGAGTVTQETF